MLIYTDCFTVDNVIYELCLLGELTVYSVLLDKHMFKWHKAGFVTPFAMLFCQASSTFGLTKLKCIQITEMSSLLSVLYETCKLLHMIQIHQMLRNEHSG